EGLSRGARGRPGQPAGRTDRRGDHCRRRGPADPLRRPAALGRGAVLRAAGDAGRASLGPVRNEGGAGPGMSAPRASGYFRTSYARDSALLDTRAQKLWLGAFSVALAGVPFVAGAFLLDLANQVLLTSIGAVALMLLTGYAGQISLGHAGLLAAG